MHSVICARIQPSSLAPSAWAPALGFWWNATRRPGVSGSCCWIISLRWLLVSFFAGRTGFGSAEVDDDGEWDGRGEGADGAGEPAVEDGSGLIFFLYGPRLLPLTVGHWNQSRGLGERGPGSARIGIAGATGGGGGKLAGVGCSAAACIAMSMSSVSTARSILLPVQVSASPLAPRAPGGGRT